LTAHLDYLRVFIPIKSIKDVETVVRFIVPKEGEWYHQEGYRGMSTVKIYHHIIQSTHYVSGAFNLPGEGGKYDDGELMLEMSGKFWSGLSVVDQWRCCLGLYHAYQARCSRIDYALDDYIYSIIPQEEMYAQRESPNRCHFDCSARIDSINGAKEHFITDYYGSRQSNRYVRVYDHEKECLRMEVEMKGLVARTHFEQLVKIEREESEYTDTEKFEIRLQQHIAQVVVGTIDFRDRDRGEYTEKKLSRCPRLPFYQEFLDKVGGALRVALPKVQRTVEKTIAWVKRQCMPILAALRRGVGGEKWVTIFQEATKAAAKRQSSEHRILEETLRNNPGLLFGMV
jgi:DNA relaxase NicK